MRRIIDNKRIDLTNDEFDLYQDICRSYDRPNFQGEELFKNHFETNEHGTIIFVRPPQNRTTTLEVFTFLISIMVNQHLRISQEQNVAMIKEASDQIKSLIKNTEKLQEEVKEAVEKLAKSSSK